MTGRKVQYGKHHTRHSFSGVKEVLDLPNLIEIQTDSFKDFLDNGLREVFEDVLPIMNFTDTMELEFTDCELREPKYTLEEARIHDASYPAPIFVTFRSINKETGKIKTQEVFFGDFPIMTEMGTFTINDGERTIVSQLVRSPGVYFSDKVDKNGKVGYGSTVVPSRGAWLKLETDSKDITYTHIDRTYKIPFTTLIRVLGFSGNDEIMDISSDNGLACNTIEKDIHKNPADSRTSGALEEIYKRLHPDEPKTADSSRNLLIARPFDPRRYDLTAVGRYKIDEKLNVKTRLLNQTTAENLVDTETSEILVETGTAMTCDVIDSIAEQLDGNLNKFVYTPNGYAVVTEPVILQKFEVMSPANPGRAIIIVGNTNPNDKTHALTPTDILAKMSYFLSLAEDLGRVDDINHLGNRRIRAVDELLANQFRIDPTRMERNVHERTSVQDNEVLTPQQIISIRPVTAAVKEFLGSSQSSQFMDQHNPPSKLFHRRHLSALGPGGLTRDCTGHEIRDVHCTHYGRTCPIGTPEGPNIGLINNLSTYGHLSEYGFIQTPYRKVNRATSMVTNETVWLAANGRDEYTITQANSKLNEDETFAEEIAMGCHQGNDQGFPSNIVDLVDVSPKQMVAVAIACIPFLGDDDSSRALMGANMQRQAVPLIDPHAPYVGTGMEYQAAHDSGAAVIAKHDGRVVFSDTEEAEVRREGGSLDAYHITKFRRSNSDTAYNQRTLVKIDDITEKGDFIANGPSMEKSEMALGQNPIVVYMTWDGYNYEDTIIMSERLVREDVYTSVHLEEFESETRDTRLGPEEITREIPNVSGEALKSLDEMGIIRTDTEVKEGNVLVDKVTPKGEKGLSTEERPLCAISGDKSCGVRNTSLRVPYGGDGVVHDVKIFTRTNDDELRSDVNMLARIYTAQKRKIKVGDKMVGHHGNEGVVFRVVPVEDMPYLPDGAPVDIMLNPLGVPSHVNVEQIMELHLSMAARNLGIHIATPVFDEAISEDLWDTARETGMDSDAEAVLYGGRTSEPSDNRVSIGIMYVIKLHHMTGDKLHVRSVNPCSLVTQQSLSDKAQFGGQHFDEMEVWALEAYDTSNVLQGILTYKSDDVTRRLKAYEAITKGKPIPRPGVPESFQVLVKELQSLGSDMCMLDGDDNEVGLRDLDEGEDDDVMHVDDLEKARQKQEAESTEKVEVSAEESK